VNANNEAAEKVSPNPGYRPARRVEMGPPFEWPPRPRYLFRWLFGFPGYLWPWSILFLGLSVASWHYAAPDTESLRGFSSGWIVSLLMWNLATLVLVAGAWHLWFYVLRAQGIHYKYNGRWLSRNNPTFLFSDQLWDNVFWNLCSAVPIWTAYEALTVWLQANGILPTVAIQEHPVYCALLFLLTPIWVVAHFYFTHRLIHWAPLYRTVHYIHHKNSNPGPWSGLAMHPAEHVILFSAVILFWFIPSHPLNAIYLLAVTALSAAEGHLGFDAIALGGERSLSAGDYMHYLHHRYVTVNFGSPMLPLDKWLGTLYDGSAESAELLKDKKRPRAW
jgi:sterol desaturase/sphingolipid hydroxylase (fatty acid hydroxylase superfamily)